MIDLVVFEASISDIEADLKYLTVYPTEVGVRQRALNLYEKVADMLEYVAEELDRLAQLEK